jgi:homoserine dehydrogenase
MTAPLRIALAGLGTVGGGVVQILAQQAELVAARAGRPVEIVAVSARDKARKRSHDISTYRWVDDPLLLASLPDADVVVELIGGSEGVARRLVDAALQNGKHVVTANKALLAHHGLALAKLAESRKVALAYEAAVAGGIPVIKALREGLAANRISRVSGILNGTCNYILSTMWEEKHRFADVLAQAQAKGFAEADPSFDIDGVDASHKICLLAALAFGCAPDFASVRTEGIRRITLEDMRFAQELGYRIKLLGVAQDGQASVYPCLVPLDSPLARVQGAYNAVVIEGDAVGRILLEGAGAGALPTASAVVADLVDIARGHVAPVFGTPATQLRTSGVRHEARGTSENAKASGPMPQASSFYLRLAVADRPGVLASVTDCLRAQLISVQSLIQHPHAPEESAQIVLTTHVTTEAAMARALSAIHALGMVVQEPVLLRIADH